MATGVYAISLGQRGYIYLNLDQIVSIENAGQMWRITTTAPQGRDIVVPGDVVGEILSLLGRCN